MSWHDMRSDQHEFGRLDGDAHVNLSESPTDGRCWQDASHRFRSKRMLRATVARLTTQKPACCDNGVSYCP